LGWVSTGKITALVVRWYQLIDQVNKDFLLNTHEYMKPTNKFAYNAINVVTHTAITGRRANPQCYRDSER